jgi:hypothetical protein
MPFPAPIAAAAFAAGITLKTLRAWLDRDAIAFVGNEGRAEGGWRKAAAVDVVRTAVTARLLRYGFELDEAAEVLTETFNKRLGKLGSADAAMPAIIARLAGCRVTVSREKGRTDIALITAEAPDLTKGRQHVLMLDLGKIALAASGDLDVWFSAEGAHR